MLERKDTVKKPCNTWSSTNCCLFVTKICPCWWKLWLVGKKVAKCILFLIHIYTYFRGFIYERKSMCSEILTPSFWLFNKCWLNLILSVVLISLFPKLLPLWQLIFRSVDFYFFLFIFYWKVYYCAQLALLGINIILVEILNFNFFSLTFFSSLVWSCWEGKKRYGKIAANISLLPSCRYTLKNHDSFCKCFDLLWLI